MTAIKKTKENPHGLSVKQDLVIKDVANKIRQGKNPKIVESVEKFYDVKNRNSAKSVVSYNMNNSNFRGALVASLVEKNIIGANSETEGVLLEGLTALDKEGRTNHDTRLKFVQEINKIAGVYAAERKESLNLNVDISEEDLDRKIKELQDQLL